MGDFSARLLLVRVGDIVVAVDATAVREILGPQAVTRIPGAPPAVRGMINVRGELVTLVQGSVLLGRADDGPGETVVLMRWRETGVAVTVHEVVDLISVPDAELTRREDLPGIDPALVRAVGMYSGRAFLVLDLDALFEPLLAA
jgi:purine-binding chemotaxis protein CheW